MSEQEAETAGSQAHTNLRRGRIPVRKKTPEQGVNASGVSQKSDFELELEQEAQRTKKELRKRIKFPDEEGFVVSAQEAIVGIAPRVGVLLIAGQSRAGKSFWACELAGCYATSMPFIGHAVSMPRPVLYLASEAPDTIGKRLEAARQHRFGGIPKKEFFVPTATFIGSENVDDVISTIESLLNEARLAVFREGRGIKSVGAIVVDTLAAAFHVEEDNQKAATVVMTKLSHLAVKWQILIVGVTHFGKTESAGVRGASAWTASADVILAVTARINEATGVVTNRKIALTKCRDGETKPLQKFDIRPTVIKVEGDGNQTGAAIIVGLDGLENAPSSDADLYLELLTDLRVTEERRDPLSGFLGVPRSILVSRLRTELPELDQRTFSQKVRRAENKLKTSGKIVLCQAGSGKRDDVLVAVLSTADEASFGKALPRGPQPSLVEATGKK